MNGVVYCHQLSDAPRSGAGWVGVLAHHGRAHAPRGALDERFPALRGWVNPPLPSLDRCDDGLVVWLAAVVFQAPAGQHMLGPAPPAPAVASFDTNSFASLVRRVAHLLMGGEVAEAPLPRPCQARRLGWQLGWPAYLERSSVCDVKCFMRFGHRGRRGLAPSPLTCSTVFLLWFIRV